MKLFCYRSLTKSSAFIAGHTHTNISYMVHIFSQFEEQPGMSHWNGLMHLLEYVKVTKNLKLNISDINNLNLWTYIETDLASNRNDHTSMGGFIIFFLNKCQ